MKRTKGISRNRLEAYQLAKSGATRKKHIFKVIGKEEQLSQDLSTHTNHLLSATTKNSVHSVDTMDSNPALEIYQEAKAYLKDVGEYRNKMTSQIKLRMTAFKDSEIKNYDQNISKYSHKALDNLLKSQKLLGSIKRLKSHSDVEEKFYRNMERSLALEIRQVSKGLRSQQKEYFERLKAYESGSANLAIQLNQKDRERMKDDFEDMQVCQTEMGEDQQRNKQITELVKSINQLNGVYRQLTELVIQQGTLIDRIDFNIEETFNHVQRGVDHLKSAEKHAESPCAQKCMFILILLILAMACVIGFKLSK